MSQCIQSSTTIISTLDHIAFVIDGKRQWILQEEEQAHINSAMMERYLIGHNISVEVFKNKVQKEFAKQQKQHDVQVLKKIETQQHVNGGFGGGPKKDDDEENNKNFWENLKSRSDKSARSSRFGKMYRDPVTKLWWSRDLSGHGGSFYKVFKEGAKGFEWLFDAVEDGTKMLNKHKGPIGIFIPYKEVIFKA